MLAYHCLIFIVLYFFIVLFWGYSTSRCFGSFLTFSWWSYLLTHSPGRQSAKISKGQNYKRCHQKMQKCHKSGGTNHSCCWTTHEYCWLAPEMSSFSWNFCPGWSVQKHHELPGCPCMSMYNKFQNSNVMKVCSKLIFHR